VAVLDGAGGELACRVETVTRKKVQLEVQGRTTDPPPPWQITLVQAIPKGKIVRSHHSKGDRTWAWRIVPCSPSASRPSGGRLHRTKAEKWRQTAVEAIKQCGQRWLPQVEPPMTLPAWLARGEKFDLTLVASLQEDSRHLRAYFPPARGAPGTICVWIGPEGDFAPEEMEAIKGAGALPITLGPLVLRSETAALCALSIINICPRTNFSTVNLQKPAFFNSKAIPFSPVSSVEISALRKRLVADQDDPPATEKFR
jgi:16S rRNA (uracil1498-N3)-methyltransferase